MLLTDFYKQNSHFGVNGLFTYHQPEKDLLVMVGDPFQLGFQMTYLTFINDQSDFNEQNNFTYKSI